MEKQNYDLLVVGNGFDLACGFQTKYTDFLDSLDYYKQQDSLILFFAKARQKNFLTADDWNSFEKLFCHYLQFINYILTNADHVTGRFSDLSCFDSNQTYYSEYYEFTIYNFISVPNEIICILLLTNPLPSIISFYEDSNYTKEIYKVEVTSLQKPIFGRIRVNASLSNRNKQYVYKVIIEKLNESLENLEKALKKYIANATNSIPNFPNDLCGCSVERIVSFNYSKTAEKLFSLNDDRVAYIHGNIDSNVILGIESSMISEQSFDENSDFLLFFKRFRRIYKNCNENYQFKIEEKLYINSIVGIFGHSLDVGDRSILLPLFKKRLERYDIYFYQDLDECKKKLSRLIGLDLYDELNKEGKIHLIKIE